MRDRLLRLVGPQHQARQRIILNIFTELSHLLTSVDEARARASVTNLDVIQDVIKSARVIIDARKDPDGSV